MSNQESWPDQQQDPIGWIAESFRRMHAEIECCEKHLEGREFANISFHMANLMQGCKVTAEMVVSSFMSHDEIVAVMAQRLQEQLGMPVTFVGEVGGYIGFEAERVEAPDDLSELDESGQ